jgi:hypothetical protein
LRSVGRLKLPNLDCTARRRLFDSRYVKTANGGYQRAPDCTCLTMALSDLGKSATKGEVLAQSGEHHRAWEKAYPRRRRKPKLEPAPETVAPAATKPLAALPPGPEPPPPPNPPQERAPRFWWQKQPAHPLSPHAFRRSQEGRIDSLNTEF